MPGRGIPAKPLEEPGYAERLHCRHQVQVRRPQAPVEARDHVRSNHEFELNKSLERILYAMCKTKNDLKEDGECRSNEEVFRQSVRNAVQFGRPSSMPTSYGILQNKGGGAGGADSDGYRRRDRSWRILRRHRAFEGDDGTAALVGRGALPGIDRPSVNTR